MSSSTKLQKNHIERKKGETLYVYVKINGAVYTFPCNVSKISK